MFNINRGNPYSGFSNPYYQMGGQIPQYGKPFPENNPFAAVRQPKTPPDELSRFQYDISHNRVNPNQPRPGEGRGTKLLMMG